MSHSTKAEQQQRDGPGDVALIPFFDSDPELLSHQEHGCHAPALQCRVLHPVKYAQLSDMWSERRINNAC